MSCVSMAAVYHKKLFYVHAGPTQAQEAPLMGMSLSGYRKWEQGKRTISGPAVALLRGIEREPEAVRRALVG